MRLDKLPWYPHWVFCMFRKNTNMPLTPRQDQCHAICKSTHFSKEPEA
jgi:hypothetical protein